MAALRSSYGVGRYVASEGDYVLATADKWNGGGPPLIYCHGAGDVASTSYSNDALKTGQYALIRQLGAMFTVCVADLGGDVWGNSTHVARIDSVRQYLSSSWGASGPVVLVTGSMGTLGGMSYALANPDNVRAIASAIPALDLNDIVVNNRGGAAAAVNAVYGGAYSDTNDGPYHSPVKFATRLSGRMPIALWTASDDPLVVPATATAFVAARPSTARTNVGALGHSEASVAAATPGIVSFVSQFA